MPTENRSSNTEMVSVPRSLAERIKQTCMFTLAENDYEDLRVAIGKSAPQPQPEPIAWMVGTAFWWTKEEAERDEAATGLPIVGLGPMTGAAEVERLRVELGYMREERDDLSGKLDRFYSRTHGIKNLAAIEELSDKLAERDALLREALEFIDDGVGRSDAEWRLIKKVRAALSPDAGASATDEPYQGIPGTSFQRLNALANQGE